EEGRRLMIVNAAFIKPLDHELLKEIAALNKPIHIYTADMLTGGLPSLIGDYYLKENIKAEVHAYGIEDHFVQQGTVEELKEREHISLDDLFLQLI
ncbi:MAG: 1-deoxy-D-xylulose-5-phosphate synthase, partial [Erysipelotrichaceae bacterium]|nr:1-deoxy-D-xylulose-5-phosphate synthase [Erysipelotrichaceae bacterium]